jgi:hypothetical protein
MVFSLGDFMAATESNELGTLIGTLDMKIRSARYDEHNGFLELKFSKLISGSVLKYKDQDVSLEVDDLGNFVIHEQINLQFTEQSTEKKKGRNLGAIMMYIDKKIEGADDAQLKLKIPKAATSENEDDDEDEPDQILHKFRNQTITVSLDDYKTFIPGQVITMKIYKTGEILEFDSEEAES